MDSSQRSTSNLEKILLSFIPVVERIIVTPEFIDYRDEMKTILEEDGSDRSEKTRLMAADCLLLEYELIKQKLVSPPKTKGQDFIIDEYYVDNKTITSIWFPIYKQQTLDNHQYNIDNGLLTHYSFHKYKLAPTEPFKAGDVTGFDFIRAEESQYVLNRLVKSNFKGWRYGPVLPRK